MKWIKCADEMPPEYKEVLVAVVAFENYYIEIMHWEHNWGQPCWFDFNEEKSETSPTHWMLLPEPPWSKK